MKITVRQAQGILNFLPTVEGVINVIDARVAYANKKVRYNYDEIGETFMTVDDNDEYVVTEIEFLFQSGNMDDDDTIGRYMTETLGISKDEFEIEWDMIGGNAWMYMAIH